jgi:hypothetical protein
MRGGGADGRPLIEELARICEGAGEAEATVAMSVIDMTCCNIP